MVVDQGFDCKHKFFASVVQGLIELPVGVFKGKVAVRLVHLLQEELQVGLMGVSKGEKGSSCWKRSAF